MRKTEKMTNLKSNKGITLIALVITIIVLLILAGVAISMLSGENGILKQAAEAKTETDRKSTEEQVKLAAMAAITNMEHKINEETLKNELTSSFGAEGTGYAIEKTGTTGYLVKVPATGESQYKITTKGTVREKSIVEDITSTNYGDYIKGYKDLTDIEGKDKDWQVFYNDGENVWIIASDYVQVADGTAGMTTSGYYAWWNSAPSGYTGKYNAKCAAALADTTKWTAYVDEDLAEKAMGGPDIEMFSKSYNAKYPSKTIQFSDEFENGYKVKWNTDLNYIDYISGLQTEDDMYVITETPADTGKAYAYWLASPSENSPYSVLCVACNGDVYYLDSGFSDCNGVRPVVCLKSDIQATASTDTENNITTWTIDK